MSVSARWRSRLRTRRQLLAAAVKRKASPVVVARRRAQVTFAERVVRRHSRRDISVTALRVVAPWLSKREAATLSAALSPAFREFNITSPARACAAVAQFAHESAGFRTTTEYASGAAYDGRRDLGNVTSGDGVRFRGRGFIQITGRANYKAVTQVFHHDFLHQPEDLASPKYAALASCWWWKQHGCNELADAGDFSALTLRINGGYNGLADRQAYWRRARKVARALTPR